MYWTQQDDKNCYCIQDSRNTWSIYAILSHVENVVNFETCLTMTLSHFFPRRKEDLDALENLKSICCTEVSRISKTMNLSPLYFVSLLKGPVSHPNDPDTCGDFRCTRQILSKEEYKTRHDIECAGNCRILSVDQNQLQTILRQGTIPGILISQDSESGEMLLDVIAYTEGIRYVAISHIWADGMGNEQSNALPECQIRRLSHLLYNLKAINDTPLIVWMDTLCCPVSSEKGRSLAISFMQRTYQNSIATLVLDVSLESIDISGLHDVEILMRIAISQWQRRLWTLQEGFLSHKVYVQFRDEAYDPWEGVLRAGNMKERWRMPILASVVGSWLEISGLGDLSAVLRKAVNPLALLSKTLNYRATSVPGDEPLCLATLVGFSESRIRAIFAIPKSDPEGRMKKFWEMYTTPPPHIIFNRNPRLSNPGFRWAPKTFLQGNNSLPGFWEESTSANIAAEQPWESTYDPLPQAELTKSGLSITASGFFLNVAPISSFLPPGAPMSANSDDAAEFSDQKFFFRDQEGSWFVVQVIYAADCRHKWHSQVATMHIALVLQGMPGDAELDCVGMSVTPSVEHGLAALVIVCDDQDEGTPNPAANLAAPSQNASAAVPIPIRKHSTSVLSIGVARVSKVGPPESQDLDRIQGVGISEKWDIALERKAWEDMDGINDPNDRLYFYSMLFMFHDIQGTFVNDNSWCFT